MVLQLLQLVYPDLYRVDTLSDEGAIKEEDENGAEILIPQPNRLQLSFEKVSATGKNFSCKWLFFREITKSNDFT